MTVADYLGFTGIALMVGAFLAMFRPNVREMPPIPLTLIVVGWGLLSAAAIIQP